MEVRLGDCEGQMEPEIIIGIAGVFVSGCAIGSVSILAMQWAARRLSGDHGRPPPLEAQEMGMLRGEVADLSRVVRDLGERVDFQERLLAGETPKLPRTQSSDSP